MSEDFVVGIDLGGTKILSVCLDAGLKVVGRDLRPTEAEEGRDAVIGRMLASARAAAAGRSIRAIGVSTPGPCDPERGIVTTPPNLPGWRDVPLARLVSEGAGLPAWIENDANAAALAESRLGAGRGAKHLVLLTLGTGIGGGLVLDGRLYHGASGAGGEVGHMQIVPGGRACGCGRNGCLEAVASGSALDEIARNQAAADPDGTVARLAREAGEEPSARTLEDAANAGDAQARAAVEQVGRYLGTGLTNLVDIFNPEVIVLGGGVRKMGELLLGPAREVVAREAFPQSYADVRIVEATLGDEAPAIGAALTAIDRAGPPR